MPRSSDDLGTLAQQSRYPTGSTVRRVALGVLRSFPAFERNVAPRLYRMREIYGWHYGLRKLRKLSRRGWPDGGCRIVVGAAGAFDRPWIPTDIEYFNVVDDRDWATWFTPGSVDALLAEHVWEHLAPAEGKLTARHCFKYLRPGGYLRAAVPDGHHPDPDYIEAVKIGGSGPSANDHKVLFTYQTFSEVFRDAGFEVELLEYYDEQGRFHEVNWDSAAGRVRRSRRHARSDRSLLTASIILDARKPRLDGSSSNPTQQAWCRTIA